MDLTQDKIGFDDEQTDLNITSQKKKFQELMNDFTQKPHALYYRTHLNDQRKELNFMPSTKTYSNTSMQRIEISTIISSTILDELYDENLSTTEDTFTTESLYTSTEIDNVTEISFFENKNQSVVKPMIPKKFINKDCGCNLLYNVCDINCCCDNDCSEAEKNIFVNCKNTLKRNDLNLHSCYPYEFFSYQESSLVENLFCIVKTNLPEKRNKDLKKFDSDAVAHSYKWHSGVYSKHTEFQKKPYVYGEPVWVLKDGSIWYIDTPSTTINNYCTGRKPILFLKNEKIKCIVNLKDLEMFKILKTPQEAPCISVTEKSMNTTALNCSTLHCTNWTITVCNGIECVDYNKSLHDPTCTETSCTNLALKLEYVFYYHDSKIINATIKLFTQNISLDVPYMTQQINVRFIISNVSMEKIIEISGNPGYIHGHPVISSSAEANRSLNFFNITSPDRKYLVQSSNKDGVCMLSNTENNYIMFGLNKRIKCRYIYNKGGLQNGTNLCNDIESHMEQEFVLNNKLFVSPLGNPLDIKDSDWVPIQNNLDKKEITYGQFVTKNSKLRCYNVITRISYIFTYADVSLVTTKRENKIISVNINVTTQNVTFTFDDISTVITIDINFIDGTKPRVYEYAAGPHLDIHLPKDFFFPFPSNGFHVTKQCSNLILMCYIVLFQIK
ncbi:tectonic-1 isoform X1 [Ostrinia nubilalis]|uniref:tectonic-1 isoform X1 n=1 Tax=Ostrinia nubilalis TaxID=29057 RepID=UPI003082475E